MSAIVPIIMCGGAGARLFPASRRDYPKPFMQIGGRSLLAHSFARAAAVGARDVVVITNAAHLHLAQAEAQAVIEAEEFGDAFVVHYLLEPQGRNTAAAIALASQYVLREFGAEQFCLVMTADHLIAPLENFAADVERAAAEAGGGALVVFGVPPLSADTGYGYIGVAEKSDAPQAVQRFTEKPNLATAQEYLAAGTYYWNSGMFAFVAKDMCANIKKYAPDVWAAAEVVWESADAAARKVNFDAAAFAALPDISIDYAVIERAENVRQVAASFAWSDVGSWDSVASEAGAEASENKYHILRDTNNSYIEAHQLNDKIIAAVGLENIIIIDTPDALLVADRGAAQAVRGVVEELRGGDEFMQSVAAAPALVHRPWGTYQSLAGEAGYQVKRITVNVGQQLSLQSHKHRAEHWVVVAGLGLVQVGEEKFETRVGEYRFIPLGERHRLTNIGDELLVLIEVQCGDYLGEDDITRYADDYGRG